MTYHHHERPLSSYPDFYKRFRRHPFFRGRFTKWIICTVSVCWVIVLTSWRLQTSYWISAQNYGCLIVWTPQNAWFIYATSVLFIAGTLPRGILYSTASPTSAAQSLYLVCSTSHRKDAQRGPWTIMGGSLTILSWAPEWNWHQWGHQIAWTLTKVCNDTIWFSLSDIRLRHAVMSATGQIWLPCFQSLAASFGIANIFCLVWKGSLRGMPTVVGPSLSNLPNICLSQTLISILFPVFLQPVP